MANQEPTLIDLEEVVVEKQDILKKPLDEDTSEIIDVVVVKAPGGNENVYKQIVDILDEDNKAKQAPDYDEPDDEPEFHGPRRMGCSWCCTDLNRPWPPMWAPHSPEDDNSGDEDEELDLEMIYLTKPDAVLKDVDEKSSFLTDIWRCFTTVRE